MATQAHNESRVLPPGSMPDAANTGECQRKVENAGENSTFTFALQRDFHLHCTRTSPRNPSLLTLRPERARICQDGGSSPGSSRCLGKACAHSVPPQSCANSVSLGVVLGLQAGGLPGHQPSRNTNKASPSMLCAQGGETPRTLEQDTWLQLGCEARPPAFLGQDSPNGACPELPGGLLT